MRRQFRLPATQHISRNTLTEETAQSITKSLRSLRKISKAIHAAAQSLKDELHILERVYYKNQNAQRVTVPWRKIVEVRRVSGRLREAGVASLIDSTRESFYDTDGSKASEKLMKSAWSRVPSQELLESAISRLQAIRQLVSKNKDVCSSAYSIHTKYLNNTGFMPYTVVIVSLIARLSRIASEHDELILAAVNTILQLLEAVKPGSSGKYALISSIQSSVSEILPVVQPDMSLEADLDLGQAILREAYEPETKEQATIISVPLITLVEDEDEGADQPETQLKSPSEVAIDIEQTLVIQGIPRSKGRRNTISSQGTEKVKKMKQRPKRDEIDDIFGF